MRNTRKEGFSWSARLAVVGLVALVAGCTEGAAPAGVSANPVKPGGGGTEDVVQDTTVIVSDLGVPDLSGGGGPDTVKEGGFGWTCATNADCDPLNPWCIPTPDGKVCTVSCVETCPAAGWGCKQVDNLAGGDTAFICVPLFPRLCDPCRTDADCQQEGVGDVGDRCIPRPDGQGSFCGGECSAGIGCPDGYDCVDVQLGTGVKRQCMPTSGACVCSEAAVARQAETACSRSSEDGTCTGVRVCEVQGLTDCSATVPAAESCNGKDDDCDGDTDEADAAGCTVYFKDVDGDAFGIDGDSRCLCTPGPVYRATEAGDCDDTTGLVNPGMDEFCNQKDDDCDNETDEAGATGCTTLYADVDTDQWGNTADAKCLCAATGVYTATKDGDCDDGDIETYPGAPETCASGKDANCDKQVLPEGSPGCTTFYRDGDGDKFGVTGDSRCLCAAEGVYSATADGDCADGDKSVHPGVAEVCDSKDNDCDGITDPEGSGQCTTYLKDADKDTYGVDGDVRCLCAPQVPYTALIGGDCNDVLGTVSPGGTESCLTVGLDDDCDGKTDEEDAELCQSWYLDEDEDTYGVTDAKRCLCGPDAVGKYTTQKADDCDDSDADAHPEALEICNQKDDDCDGFTDEEGAGGCETYFLDNDGDTHGVSEQSKCLCGPTAKFTATVGGDCDDGNAGIHKGVQEVCDNGVDNNCNGETDEEGGVGCITYYKDADEDTWGVTGNTRCLCAPVAPHNTLKDGDCKDTNENIHPGQLEVCDNGVDNNCNGQTDEEGADGCKTYYQDHDQDQFGVAGSERCLCAPDGEWTAIQSGDCNDQDLLVKPGAECQPGSCSGYLLTKPLVCGGDGTCSLGGETAPCPGGFLCANASACKTQCAADSDCVAGNFCVTGLCSGKKLDGSTCSDDNQCQSGHCQNGFCCQSGRCCGGSSTHCDDGNVCTDDKCSATYQCTATPNQALCAASTCDGSVFTAAKFCLDSACPADGVQTTCETTNACKVQQCTLAGCKESNAQNGTICQMQSCTGNTVTTAKACTAGACTVGGQTLPCPGGFVCSDSFACRTDCTGDPDCAAGFFCQTGQCLPKRGDGTQCIDSNECSSGHCGNGYCCGAGACCSKASDCDDGNVCTTDACSPSFQCQNANNTNQCAAGFCSALTYTEPRYCSGGACVSGGAEQSCTGANPCILYGCGAAGCTQSPAPIGSLCQAGYCFDFLVTSDKKCDGTGLCSIGGAQTSCPGGFRCLDELQCRPTCTDDAHCQSGLFCNTGFCSPKQVAGAACAANNQCESAHCENGFCCGQGRCCASDANCDDGNVCTNDTCGADKQCQTTYNTAQCSAPSCDGMTFTHARTCTAGVCPATAQTSACAGTDPCLSYSCRLDGCAVEPAAAGTPCKDPICGFDGQFTAAKSCNGLGLCGVGGGSQKCPGGFVCADLKTCKASCATDVDCQIGWYCTPGGTCQEKKDPGQVCDAANQCKASHCQNGFCCAFGDCCSKNADCDDQSVCTDDSCNASFICDNVPNTAVCVPGSCTGLQYTNPKTCFQGTCGQGGGGVDCSGTDPCIVYGCSDSGCTVSNTPAGTGCAAPVCSGGQFTAALTCDGQGQCSGGGSTAACPGGFVCSNGTACKTVCATDTDCAAGFFCSAPVCSPKRANGDACGASNQCTSGYCHNGFCCVGPTGDCCSKTADCDDGNGCTNDACGVSKKCTYTNNTALCLQSSCDGLTYAAPKYCSGGACPAANQPEDCSGTDPCRTYGCGPTGCTVGNAASGVQCQSATCSGSSLTQSRTCNGAGGCTNGGQTAPCPGGFTCADGATCRSSCTLDQHCQSGFYCQTGICKPKRVDGDTCTQALQCLSGYCGNGYCCVFDALQPKCCGGFAAHCDDGNACTVNECDILNLRCTGYDNDGFQCQGPSCNGVTYTAGKICLGGACSIGGSESQCLSSNPCKTSVCTQTGCQLVNVSAGAPCDVGSCSGYTLTASKICDGGGICVTGGGSGPCIGGFVCADASSCKSSCTQDSDCQPGLFCQGTACVSLKANGQQCTTGTECQSSWCNNGFCCGSGQECCQVDADCSDGNACTTDDCTVDFACTHTNNTVECVAGSCNGDVYTLPKTCNGAGSCNQGGGTQTCVGGNACQVGTCSPSTGCSVEFVAQGTQCGAPACSGSTLTQTRTCNASGQCSVGGQTGACPGNLTCQDASQCRTVCTLDVHCVPGNYCSSGQCLPRKADGATCSASNQCTSDYCNSGVCCSGGTCCVQSATCEDGNVCTTNLCQNNTCQILFNGEQCQAPQCSGLTLTASKWCQSGVCQVGGQTTDCSGTNACRVYGCSAAGCTDSPAPLGTQCGAGSCADALLTQPATCDGAGGCTAGTTAPCPGNYACQNANGCRGTCTVDAHCANGSFCQNGNCLPKRVNGGGCSNGVQCLSGYCSNGFCCDAGQCCSDATDCGDQNICTTDLCQNNACTWVNNQASCGSGTCAGLLFTTAKTCLDGACDGGGATENCQGADPCKTYSCTANGCAAGNQPAGTQCAGAVCTGSTLTTARQCNAGGACSDGGSTGPCPSYFVCKNSTQCHTQCTGDAQCVAGAYCAGGACVPQKADGQFCTAASQCQSSYCEDNICCAGGTCCTSGAKCNDANVCTTDTCTNYMCGHTNNTALCATSSCNGLMWTAPKYCSGGACTQGGLPQDCAGGAPCLTYSCANVAGCGSSPRPAGAECASATCNGTVFSPSSLCDGAGSCDPSSTTECDDGDPCTGQETCSPATGCTAGTPPATCGDGLCDPSCEVDIAGCASDCTCTPSHALRAGEIDAWSTSDSGSTAALQAYPGCTALTYPGREVVYSFVSPVTGQVQVGLRGADASTDVLVLAGSGGCDPGQCIARAVGSGGTVAFSATQGATYYFVVDRRVTGSVTYEIYVRPLGECHVAFTEDWQRTPFPRAWAAEANWQSAQNSPFGATHAKFTGAPILTAFSRSLTSPRFDTSACSGSVVLQLSWNYKQVTAHTGVTVHVEISVDDGGSWADAFTYALSGGDSQQLPTTVTSSDLAGKTAARVRIRVEGDTNEQMDRFQVDNVCVRSPTATCTFGP